MSPAVEELRGTVAVYVADGVFSEQRSRFTVATRQRDDHVKTFGSLIIRNVLGCVGGTESEFLKSGSAICA